MSMPKKRLPTIADRAVWEKVSKGRAGRRWDSVVEEVWKDVGASKEKTLSIETFAGYNLEVKSIIEIRETLALRNKAKEKEYLRDLRGFREEIRMKTYLHGAMDYVKTMKLRIRVGDLDLPERRGIPVVGRRKDVPLWQGNRAELTWWEHVKCMC